MRRSTERLLQLDILLRHLPAAIGLAVGALVALLFAYVFVLKAFGIR